MKLVKLAVMLSVALFAALLVSDNGALASVASRSVTTGAAYSAGVLYPVTLGTDGTYSRRQSTLVVNYNNSEGTLIARDANGVFQGGFNASQVTALSTTSGPANDQISFKAGFGAAPTIAGSYTNAANETVPAIAFLSIVKGFGQLTILEGGIRVPVSYWDFNYNTTTGVVSAVSVPFVGNTAINLIVKNTANTEYFIGNGTPSLAQPVSYTFFNESDDVDTYATTILGTFGGVINVIP